jgi:hypothetical protein
VLDERDMLGRRVTLRIDDTPTIYRKTLSDHVSDKAAG